MVSRIADDAGRLHGMVLPGTRRMRREHAAVMTLTLTLVLAAIATGRADAQSGSDAVSDDADPAKTEYASDEYGEGPRDVLDEDSVFRQIWRRRPPLKSLFGSGASDALESGWRDVNDEIESHTGLRFGLAYTTLAQWAPNSPEGDQGIAGDLDFTGIWRLLDAEDAGYLGFATEWRHDIGPRQPAELSGEFDAFSRTTQAFNEQDFAIVELWWSQEFLGDRLEITAGKINPRTFYNTNRLRNQNTTFLNQVFTGNRAIGFPGRGGGANATWRSEETWYLSGGVHDANAVTASANLGTLDEGEFAYVMEFGWTPTFEELGRGSYRLTLWHTDSSRARGTDDGTGFALSCDQELGESLIGFVRYAYADGDALGAKQTLSGGLGINGLFDRDADLLGLGVGWSDPSADTFNEEVVAEAFYRLQVTSSTQLSLGWQGYFTPAFDPDDDVVNVFSLRWRIQL